MYECYTLELEGSALRFAPRKDGGKDLAYLPGQPPKGYTLINLIGDPGLLHCAIFRKEEGPGGFFVMHDTEGMLFMAVADTNLTYGMGLAHMGRMVTYARYGADIFEELSEDDG
ncbi:hypothetical protein [Desulfovibrio desulfuricans]|uniref:hypothetical protein n=1 Tax=Desulfovibrio desulfuricans TaxID=876 RepID=UPI0035B2BB8C